jgi:hypothetical protein
MFLAHWAAQLIISIQLWAMGVEGDSFVGKLLRNTAGPALMGYATIYAGVLMAPSGKKSTSLVLAAFFVLLSSLSLQSGLAEGNLWQVVDIMSSIFGSGMAVYLTFEEGIDEL